MLYNYATAPRAGPTQQIQQIIRRSHEQKNSDTANSAGLSGTTVPISIVLNSLSQGTGGTNRTGRQVRNETLRLTFKFETDPSSLQDDMVRILVVRDKESRGAAPSISDVVALTSTQDFELVS
jgi:hypothetical protein